MLKGWLRLMSSPVWLRHRAASRSVFSGLPMRSGSLSWRSGCCNGDPLGEVDRYRDIPGHHIGSYTSPRGRCSFLNERSASLWS